MPQSQPVNSSQVDGLSSQFQRRWEAGYHWRSMCSMLLGIPGLRAAWPMSSIAYTRPECTDISGQGNHLQSSVAMADVRYGYDANGIAPIANFRGGVNQYLTKADGGAANWADILGTETTYLNFLRGLTLGGWFYWAALPGALEMLMAKDDTGANRQYGLYVIGANTLRFIVWPGPVFVTSIATINTGWNHCAGVYDNSSQTLYVVLNGVTTTGGVGAAPAALIDTAAPFTMGADGVGGQRFDGWASGCFLSAISVSLSVIKAMYHYTKAAYGVK